MCEECVAKEVPTSINLIPEVGEAIVELAERLGETEGTIIQRAMMALTVPELDVFVDLARDDSGGLTVKLGVSCRSSGCDFEFSLPTLTSLFVEDGPARVMLAASQIHGIRDQHAVDHAEQLAASETIEAVESFLRDRPDGAAS